MAAENINTVNEKRNEQSSIEETMAASKKPMASESVCVG